MFVSIKLAAGWWFSPSTLVSSTNFIYRLSDVVYLYWYEREPEKTYIKLIG
jgi:hypothetical protein